jgi:hypothetical protein
MMLILVLLSFSALMKSHVSHMNLTNQNMQYYGSVSINSNNYSVLFDLQYQSTWLPGVGCIHTHSKNLLARTGSCTVGTTSLCEPDVDGKTATTDITINDMSISSLMFSYAQEEEISKTGYLIPDGVMV